MLKLSFLATALSQILAQAVGDSLCVYTPVLSTPTTKWCTWGCCDVYLDDPCCDSPFYVGAPFLAGVVGGSVFLVILFIVLIIFRRRRYTQTLVSYGAPGNQQVFSTSSSTSVTSGIANPGYILPARAW